jgi:hypothetical protein
LHFLDFVILGVYFIATLATGKVLLTLDPASYGLGASGLVLALVRFVRPVRGSRVRVQSTLLRDRGARN